MKRFILSIAVFLMGAMGFIMISALTLASPYTVSGSVYFLDIIKMYGLMPLLIVCIALAIIGFIAAIIECMRESKNK